MKTFNIIFKTGEGTVLTLSTAELAKICGVTEEKVIFLYNTEIKGDDKPSGSAFTGGMR